MPVNDYTRFPLSWMPDARALKYPQYLSLAALLEHDIEIGKLAPGEKLPPQRALADYLDLNFTTVTRAYELCRSKHLIYGITGRGTFVAQPAPESTSDTIELGVVLGFPGISEQIVEAARDVMQRANTAHLFSYTERTGLAHQRAAGVQWMAQKGVHTSVEQTAIFAGAQNAITTAFLSLFRFGDAIAVDRFTYANLIGSAQLAHLRLIPIAGDRDGMCPESLETACSKKHIAGIFLMPTCANPTTITMPEPRRDAISEICARHALTIIEDDAALSGSKHRTFYDRLPLQTVYIAAATRHLASGLRITFACFPERFKKPLTQGLFLTSIKASALDAEIICELITSGKAESLLNEKHQLAIQANDIFNRIFSVHTMRDKSAFFRMLPLAHPCDGPAFEHLALSNHIRVCHSYRFAVEKNPAESFLRISLTSADNFERLECGLNRLKYMIDNS